LATYFGQNSESPAGYYGQNYFWVRGTGSLAIWLCPGSGNQNILTLGFWGKSGGGVPGDARCAIYDSSDNLVCQHSAAVSINSTTAQWWCEAQGFTGTTVLTGGAYYKIGLTTDVVDTTYGYSSNEGDCTYGSVSYTAGWPATRTDGGAAQRAHIRCLVEAAAGGLSIPGNPFRKPFVRPFGGVL